MREKEMNKRKDCGPLSAKLDKANVVDIVISNHAMQRWNERIAGELISYEEIFTYLWGCLENNLFTPHEMGRNTYLVSNSLLLVAEFSPIKRSSTCSNERLYQMIIITFLGMLPDLSDPDSIFAWPDSSARPQLDTTN